MSTKPLYGISADPYVPVTPKSLEDSDRLYHRDVANLSADQLWAEATILTAELARRIYARERAYTVDRDSGDDTHDWLRERIAKVKAELRRRHQVAA